jgi:hypothetical protein
MKRTATLARESCLRQPKIRSCFTTRQTVTFCDAARLRSRSISISTLLWITAQADSFPVALSEHSTAQVAYVISRDKATSERRAESRARASLSSDWYGALDPLRIICESNTNKARISCAPTATILSKAIFPIPLHTSWARLRETR